MTALIDDKVVGWEILSLRMQRQPEFIGKQRLQHGLISDGFVIVVRFLFGDLLVDGGDERGFEFCFDVELGGIEPFRASGDLRVLDAVGHLNQFLQGYALSNEGSVVEREPYLGGVRLVGTGLSRPD